MKRELLLEGEPNIDTLLREYEEITFYKDDRPARRKISELSKEGIIFIPIATRTYRRIELCTEEEIEAYYFTQLKSMNTQYFQRLKPLTDYIKKERLNELHQGTLFEGRYYE